MVRHDHGRLLTDRGALRVAAHQAARLSGRWLTQAAAVDAAVVAVVWIGAYALRWVNLQTVPVPTDELDDVLFSLPILLGRWLPLTNFDTFNGSLYNVLLALWLKVVGLHPASPRLLGWLVSGVISPATYALGRAVGGRPAGLIAGALMATAPAEILNGRITYSNSMTPLFTTVALALLVSAINRRDGRLLALAGLAGGAALQTHISTVAMAPGGLLAVAVARGWARRFVWGAVAAAGVLLVEGPVVLYNLTTGFASVTYALGHRDRADQAAALTLARYGSNLARLFAGLLRALSGWMNDRYQVPVPLIHPVVLITAGVALVGLAALVWRRRWAVLLPSATFVLILPLVNSKYEPTIVNARYLMLLLPVVFAGVGAAIAGAWCRLADRRARTALVVGTVILVVSPLWLLGGYFESARARDLTGEPMVNATGYLAEHAEGQPVLVDEGLANAYGYGGAHALSTIVTMLTLQRIGYQVSRPGALGDLVLTEQCRLAVLQPMTAAAIGRDSPGGALDVTMVVPVSGRADYDQFGVYCLARHVDRAVVPHDDRPACPSSDAAMAEIESAGCASGTITTWRASRPGSPAIGEMGAQVMFVIAPKTLAVSPALHEVDRVQRPSGRPVEVRGHVTRADDGRAQIVVTVPEQLTFLPLP